jgi:hypothetical protein|tara:strand:- start:125 stop:286 length:162 start_codon:yes stop_codon:yes gene_type:complete
MRTEVKTAVIYMLVQQIEHYEANPPSDDDVDKGYMPPERLALLKEGVKDLEDE